MIYNLFYVLFDQIIVIRYDQLKKKFFSFYNIIMFILENLENT